MLGFTRVGFHLVGFWGGGFRVVGGLLVLCLVGFAYVSWALFGYGCFWIW